MANLFQLEGTARERPLDANQLCYVLWRMSGEALPVRHAAEILEYQIQAAYRRGRRTEARRRQRKSSSPAPER